MNQKYFKGWIPDLPDFRDKNYCKLTERVALPPSVDLRPDAPPVESQKNLGSCTTFAIIGALEYIEKKDKDIAFEVFSHLFLYYNERDLEGSVASDSGAMIRDGIKTLASLGICNETMWPYDISKFTDKPPQECYDDAKKHLITSYARLDTIDDIKNCLATGYPVIVGITVYESFETDEVAKTGIVPMPSPSEECLGGHAVSIWGFQDDKQHFIMRNSWSDGWGDKGYFYLPYDYIGNSDLATDFWTIRVLEGF